MTNTQLADLFLLRLYDIAEAEGYERYVNLVDIAAEFGVSDRMKVVNVATFLDDRSYIRASITMGPNVSAIITGEGAIYVEAGGQTGVIGAYRAHPEDYRISIDQSTHFHGSISSSNVVVHSSEISQSSGISPQLDVLLSDIAAAVRADTTLSEKHRSEHLADLDTLRGELKRQQPRGGIVNTLVSQLGDIASITSLMMQLQQYLPSMSWLTS